MPQRTFHAHSLVIFLGFTVILTLSPPLLLTLSPPYPLFSTHSATAKLLNLKNKMYGIDLNDFSSILLPHILPAVTVQKSLREGTLDPLFWKKSHTSKISLKSAMISARQIEINMADEDVANGKKKLMKK